MGELIAIDNGYGQPVGTWYNLRYRFPGSHLAYAVQSRLIVEWYDHGDHAPYDSANQLIFERPAQQQLMTALGLADLSPDQLAIEISRTFESYFDVRKFADGAGLVYEHKVDFQP